jgi:hypothetical protein
MTRPASTVAANRLQDLRANSFAATVILLIENGLGIWVNLYGHLSAPEHGASILTGFGRAVANGPVGLSIHALLGLVLIVSAVTAVVRSVLVRRAVFIMATSLGLVAIVVAASSAARFVRTGDNASSMAMALATCVAIGAYALVLFISCGSHNPARS